MKRIFAAVLALVLCFSMAACIRENLTMEEYMQKNQTMYDVMAAAMSKDDVAMFFTYRGNSLVMGATMDMEVDESIREAVAAAMEVSLEEGKQDYLDLLKTVRESVPTAESIIVEFYDSQNALILSKEFK